MFARSGRLAVILSGLVAVSACAVDGEIDPADEGALEPVRSAVGKPDFVQGRYYVGFKARPGAAERALVVAKGAALTKDLADLDALEIEDRSGAAVAALRAHGSVAYVEQVPMRYAMGLADAELEPSTGNGLYGLVNTGALAAHASGVTGAGIKACVADTSLDYTHPDIAPNYAGGIDTVGANDSDPFSDDGETHGTHVAGTVLGALNGSGVRGVAIDAQLFHARVLGPNGGTTTDIMEGVEWLAGAGCHVVNLSLGGGSKSRTEENFYKRMRQQGVLVVAAAGNDGRTRISFPAAYAVNVSVAAVDVNNAIADFSNTGRGLDISGPGVSVLSSVPQGKGFEAAVSSGAGSFSASGMEFAGTTPRDGVTGALVDCGDGTAGCPVEASGNIAVIQRGTISFADKVQAAMDAGAVAAIVYNNVDGDFGGTLGAEGDWIPAVSVSKAAGEALLASGGSATVVNAASDWDHYSGTSMATPHVAGLAALVAQARGLGGRTKADADAIEARLKATAQDLGAAGYDTTFGAGLARFVP